MTRVSLLNSPLLLGFDEFERTLERIAKAPSEGYPPYNIERTDDESLRITLAVAGFEIEDLDIQLEDNQLTIRGRQRPDGEERVFLHRGIATRQFQRSSWSTAWPTRRIARSMSPRRRPKASPGERRDS